MALEPKAGVEIPADVDNCSKDVLAVKGFDAKVREEGQVLLTEMIAVVV